MRRAIRTISDLVAEFDVLLGVDDDLLLAIDSDDLSGAIRITRVVDQTPIK